VLGDHAEVEFERLGVGMDLDDGDLIVGVVEVLAEGEDADQPI
jgi:hypothetical protein